MRINNNGPLMPIGDTANRVERPNANASAPADQIQLSRAALSAATSQNEKIAALREQVANGTYHVTSDAVARSMINEMMGEPS